MSIILLIAIVGAIVFKFNRKPISKVVSQDNKIVQLLQNAKCKVVSKSLGRWSILVSG